MYVENTCDMHQHLAKLEEETEGVRHYRFASETLSGRQQHGMSPFVPTYWSSRTMQHMPPGQRSYLRPPSGSGQYPMYYPPASQGNV